MNAFNAYRYLKAHRNHSVSYSNQPTYQITEGNMIQEVTVENGKPKYLRKLTPTQFRMIFPDKIFVVQEFTLYEQV